MWKTSNLTDLASVSTGKWDANHSVESGRYRFYTCAANHLYSDTKRFSGECLILPGNGANVGDVYFYEGDFDAYQRTYVIHDIKIIPKFLYYHLLLNWRNVNAYKQFGSATNFIKIGNFKDYKVSYPPLAEQQRIVAKLDAAFAEIDAATDLLQSKSAEVKKLKAAILDKNLNEILAQKPKVKLSAACERVSVGHVGITSKYYCDDGVPFIRTQNVSKNGFDDSELKFITQEFHQSLKKSQLKAGDVLLSRVVIDEMRTAIVPSDYGEANCANVILIRPTQKLSSQFLSLLIQSRESQKYFMGVKKGAAQQVVNTGILKEWTIPLPTIEEQNTFEQTIKESFNNIENLIGDTHKKIGELTKLKSAILAKELQSEAA